MNAGNNYNRSIGMPDRLDGLPLPNGYIFVAVTIESNTSINMFRSILMLSHGPKIQRRSLEHLSFHHSSSFLMVTA